MRAIEYVFGQEPTETPDNAKGYDGPTHVSSNPASLLQFVELLLGIARRIATSLLVQLVAATAVSRQPLRLSRILSLLSVAIFFLFLQSGAATAVAHNHHRD